MCDYALLGVVLTPILGERAMASDCFHWTFAGAPVAVDLDLRVLDRLKRELLRGAPGGLLLGEIAADSPVRVLVTDFEACAPDELAASASRRRMGGPPVPVGFYR